MVMKCVAVKIDTLIRCISAGQYGKESLQKPLWDPLVCRRVFQTSFQFDFSLLPSPPSHLPSLPRLHQHINITYRNALVERSLTFGTFDSRRTLVWALLAPTYGSEKARVDQVLDTLEKEYLPYGREDYSSQPSVLEDCAASNGTDRSNAMSSIGYSSTAYSSSTPSVETSGRPSPTIASLPSTTHSTHTVSKTFETSPRTTTSEATGGQSCTAGAQGHGDAWGLAREYEAFKEGRSSTLEATLQAFTAWGASDTGCHGGGYGEAAASCGEGQDTEYAKDWGRDWDKDWVGDWNRDWDKDWGIYRAMSYTVPAEGYSSNGYAKDDMAHGSEYGEVCCWHCLQPPAQILQSVCHDAQHLFEVTISLT